MYLQMQKHQWAQSDHRRASPKPPSRIQEEINSKIATPTLRQSSIIRSDTHPGRKARAYDSFLMSIIRHSGWRRGKRAWIWSLRLRLMMWIIFRRRLDRLCRRVHILEEHGLGRLLGSSDRLKYRADRMGLIIENWTDLNNLLIYWLD